MLNGKNMGGDTIKVRAFARERRGREGRVAVRVEEETQLKRKI